MKGPMFNSVVGMLFILLAAGVLKPDGAAAQINGTYPSGLSLWYYNQTCPGAVALIQALTFNQTIFFPETAPQILRMHFHDCFVRGCDASVLIYKANGTAEMDGIPNKNSLTGYVFINVLKAAVEAICPQIVSCADIIAVAAEAAVNTEISLARVESCDPVRDWTAVKEQDLLYPFNFYWPVPLGRKDGNYSFASETLTNLPPPTFNYTQLKANFADKNLTEEQMVTLSGAHTIGTSNCTNINARLYDFNGTANSTDPSLNATVVPYLKNECPPGVITNRVAMKYLTGVIFSSNYTFDQYYYKNLLNHQGFFPSDASLITNSFGLSIVEGYASSPFSQTFVTQFNAAMVAMGQIQVTTVGQVRKNCSSYLYT